MQMFDVTGPGTFKNRLEHPAAYRVRNGKTQNHTYNKPYSFIAFNPENEHYKQKIQRDPGIRIA